MAADGRGFEVRQEHWPPMAPVEVWQEATGRRWSQLNWPMVAVRDLAGNTGRQWSRLCSGTGHWAEMVVVEVWQGTLGVAARCGSEGGGGWDATNLNLTTLI